MTKTESISTGIPGVEFRLPDLRPIVVNDELANQTAQAGEAGDRVVALIAQGRLAAASELVADARLMDPSNIRLRLLDTEVSRWSGDHERAIYRLQQLRKEFEGTADEVDSVQNLGACFYSVGDTLAAASRYKSALEGREQFKCAGVLLNASRAAYESVLEEVNAPAEDIQVSVLTDASNA